MSPDHVDVTSEYIRGAVRGGHRHHGLGLGVFEGRLPLEAEADRHGEVGLLRLVLLDQSGHEICQDQSENSIAYLNSGGIVMEWLPL